ncbi:acyl carrier protein [Streptomyces sp. SID12501]|uniref:Acyl carrier protein n=1 Tax=Streptomyces sp. SID12501 TaxID=2706042 RepID=A0A6B3BQ10_9ACTN|nr:acyl carrier protein [Streptomyces sp. SID12501]NEC86388.1 acyl carrier protein [Streptomyces sp. SID12501]
MSASYGQIVGILTDSLGRSRAALRPESTFAGLGLDSLALLELGVIVEERTGARLEGVDARSTLAETATALDHALASRPADCAAHGLPPSPTEPSEQVLPTTVEPSR